MAGLTAIGKQRLLEYFFRGAATPNYWYVALATNAVAPSDSTIYLSELVECGGGDYGEGGQEFERTPFYFETLENDTSDYAYLRLKDVTWNATGTAIPNIKYVLLIASDEIHAYWTLTTTTTVNVGEFITFQDLEIRITEGTGGITNRGKYDMLRSIFQGITVDTSFKLEFFSSNASPSADSNDTSGAEFEDSAIPLGNGYTGPITVNRNSTDFDVSDINLGNYAYIQLKDFTWTATGTLPSSGFPIKYIVLYGNNTYDVYAYFTFPTNISLVAGQVLKVYNLEIRLTN